VSRLLSAADEATIPDWTIGAFAGLRRAEIERLDRSDVDLDAHLIDIEARPSR
jgi:integrase